MDVYAGVETGGTKCVCILASSPSDIIARTQFPTESPGVTVSKIVSFFLAAEKDTGKKISALGVASFGPVDLDPVSPTFGFITSTPKTSWQNFDLIGNLAKSFSVPIAFDTDTNGAALGEYYWGAGKGLDNFLYLTIGTGIGGGGLINGDPVHGMIHPEMGHCLVPHDRQQDSFAGICPFHGDCLEGLASGPAIEARWGVPARELGLDHPAWDLEASYLAAGLHNLICALSPQRIILGGGVLNQEGLIEKVRIRVQQSLNGYVQARQILDQIDAYIVKPGLGDLAGVLGAVALAKRKFNQKI